MIIIKSRDINGPHHFSITTVNVIYNEGTTPLYHLR